jgi:geranylgeranyl diphosphate synthase type II
MMMEHMNYEATAKALLREDAALVESLLDTLYRGGGRCDEVLDRAERYSLMAGGKRVRPALTLEFCRLFGGDPAAALPFAAAVEMIHTFSLIHDDLPCMDDDDLRRGRPTNHKVFGEAYALLAGDGMALDAFGMAASNTGVSPEICARAVLLLSRAAGSEGMVRGQIMDMFGEQNTLSYEELLTLHARKTGALIRVAAQLGALAAGCAMGSPEMTAAEGYAERIGLAFQVIDDILDATSTPDVLGKSVGGDADHHKNTFLSFSTIPEAEAYAERLTSEAIALLSPYEGAERLTALANYLAVRKV